MAAFKASLLALLLLCAAAARAAEPLADLLARARALSDSPAAAYEVLAAAEDEYIGEIDFDYALGRAALEAGRPDRATLAFGRVLALDPLHAGALIDTGRAYLALGNLDQARAAFDAVLALNPPPAVRGQVLAYLVQANATSAQRLTLRGYVEANAGYSSNVNQSPATAQVFVPAFGATFDLAQQNIAKADGFVGLAGGVDAAIALDGGYALIGGAEFLQRWNHHQTAFDLGALGVRGGIARATQDSLTRAQLVAMQSDLGHAPSRNAIALGLERIESLSDGKALSFFGTGGSFRHPPASLRIFDADFLTLGATAQQLGDGWSALVGAAGGKEYDTGGNPSGDQAKYSVRAAGEKQLVPRLSAIASAGWQRALYQLPDPSFLVRRDDRRTDLELVLQYSLGGGLSLRMVTAFSEQRSNIPLYSFERNEAWVALRYEFR
jgi:tetratricopeptide (TPR) repeat protein